ncbi:MAG: hypothetical protein C4334_04200 [Pyrinomonas sp.]
MKFVIVASLIAALSLFLAWKLRPYFLFLREAWRFASEVKRTTETRRAPPSRSESLVRCASCGVLIPASRALVSRHPSVVYCSDACMRQRQG